MNFISIAKVVSSVATSLGAGLIVNNLVTATVPATTGRVGKVLIAFGSFGLGGAAAKISSTYVEETFDEIAKLVNDVKAGVKPAETADKPDVTDVSE